MKAYLLQTKDFIDRRLNCLKTDTTVAYIDAASTKDKIHGVMNNISTHN